MPNRYLSNSDYNFVIQPIQLTQLLQVQPNTNIGYNQKLIKAETTAIEEVKSYLIQRWDVNAEFTNTGTWSYNATYSAANRVILDYPNYSTQSNYGTGSCVIYNSEAYLSNTYNAATTSTPNNLGTWTDLGAQYTIYYVNYPAPLFNVNDWYNVGDVVYWKGITYSCAIPTLTLDTTQALQYNRVEWLPLPNIFPDSLANNQNEAYWIQAGTFSVPAGTLPTDTQYWTQGDNRSQQIVLLVMDIAIFNLHKSIAPQNIPDMRKDAYKEALKTLRMANTGDTSLNVLPLQPIQGLKVRFSGNVRRQNNY